LTSAPTESAEYHLTGPSAPTHLLGNGRTITSGQKYTAQNHEKGSRDKNIKAQSGKEISQVGHKNDRKAGAIAGNEPDSPRDNPRSRSGWFDDPTKEIGDAAGITQFEFGWIYRRSEIGHRRERTHNRDSVS